MCVFFQYKITLKHFIFYSYLECSPYNRVGVLPMYQKTYKISIDPFPSWSAKFRVFFCDPLLQSPSFPLCFIGTKPGISSLDSRFLLNPLLCWNGSLRFFSQLAPRVCSFFAFFSLHEFLSPYLRCWDSSGNSIMRSPQNSLLNQKNIRPKLFLLLGNEIWCIVVLVSRNFVS